MEATSTRPIVSYEKRNGVPCVVMTRTAADDLWRALVTIAGDHYESAEYARSIARAAIAKVAP